jgi:hypothetical protein
VRGGRALAQNRVGLFRDVLDLNTRHSAIMALEAPLHNRAVIGMCAGSAAVGGRHRQARLSMISGSGLADPADREPVLAASG